MLERLPAYHWPAPPGDALVAHLDALRPWLAAAAAGAPVIPLERVRLRAPVANPGRVIAVRGNYPAAGRAPVGEPELFLKASTSVAGPADGITLRFDDRRVDHEVELVAVVGRPLDQATADAALGGVAGYCVGIDVTLRGPEDRGLRKSLDGHTVLGPWLTTVDEAGGVHDAALQLSINGIVRQGGRTSQMSAGIGALLAHASRYFALAPGDVVMTGTPAGAGPLAPGDAIDCSIDGLGALRVVVRPAPQR